MAMIVLCPDHSQESRLYGLDIAITDARRCVDCINLNNALGVDIHDPNEVN